MDAKGYMVKMKTWKDYPEQTHPELSRWIESDEGDIISVVTRTPGKLRCIDGEMRYSIENECFVIPCTMRVVNRMPLSQVVRVAEKRHGLIVVNKQ